MSNGLELPGTQKETTSHFSCACSICLEPTGFLSRSFTSTCVGNTLFKKTSQEALLTNWETGGIPQSQLHLHLRRYHICSSRKLRKRRCWQTERRVGFLSCSFTSTCVGNTLLKKTSQEALLTNWETGGIPQSQLHLHLRRYHICSSRKLRKRRCWQTERRVGFLSCSFTSTCVGNTLLKKTPQDALLSNEKWAINERQSLETNNV